MEERLRAKEENQGSKLKLGQAQRRVKGTKDEIRFARRKKAELADADRLIKKEAFMREQETAKVQARWIAPTVSHGDTNRSHRSPGLREPRPRPASAGAVPLSSSRGGAHGYTQSRSRKEVLAARRQRPGTADSSRPRVEHGFVSKGLLNLDHVAVRKSKAIPSWMAKRNERSLEGREGYVNKPTYATRSMMQEMRRKHDEADMTFDIDGDGTVSQEDFKRSMLFDTNKDGVLQLSEQNELRKQMVAQVSLSPAWPLASVLASHPPGPLPIRDRSYVRVFTASSPSTSFANFRPGQYSCPPVLLRHKTCTDVFGCIGTAALWALIQKPRHWWRPSRRTWTTRSNDQTLAI